MIDRTNNIKNLFLDIIVIIFPYAVCGILLNFFIENSAIIILAYTILLIIPGLLVYRLFDFLKNYFLVHLISFSLGFSVWSMIGVLAYFFKANIIQLSFLLILVFVLLLYLNIKKVKALKVDFKLNFENFALAFLSFIFFFYALYIGSHEAGDVVFHIAFSRHILETSSINPFEAHFPIDLINPAYGYNILYLLVGYIRKIISQETFYVWRILTFTVAPLTPIGLYFLFKAINKKVYTSLSGVFIFMFYSIFFEGLVDAVTAFYPDRIARFLLIPAIVFVMFKYFEKHTQKLWLLISFLIASTFGVHLFSWLFSFIFAFIFFLIFEIKTKRNINITSLKLLLKIVILFSLFSIPSIILKAPITLKYTSNLNSNNYIDYNKDIVFIRGNMIMVNPKTIISILFIVTISLLVLSSLIYLIRKKPFTVWLKYSIYVVIIPLLLMEIPPLATIFSSLFSFIYLRRLLMFLPLFLIFGIFFNLFDKRILLNFFKVTGLSLIAVLLIWIEKPVRNHTLSTIKKIDPIYSKINEIIPKGSVIASNLWDSYYLVAYTNNYIVGLYPNHTTANVNKYERVEDLNKILTSNDNKEVENLLHKYDTDYVLIRKKEPLNNEYKRYWRASSAYYNKITNQLYLKRPGFELVYNDESFDLYKVIKNN